MVGRVWTKLGWRWEPQISFIFQREEVRLARFKAVVPPWARGPRPDSHGRFTRALKLDSPAPDHLVLKIRLVLEDGLDPFDDAFNIRLATDSANSDLSRLLRELR